MTPLSLPSHTKVSILCEINTFPGGSKTNKKIQKSRVLNAFRAKKHRNCAFSMRRKNQTMVDKIPWDTCVIALIFCVFKTEFYKSTVFRLKLLCFPLPPPLPPIQCWNSGEIACTLVQHCRGGGGRGRGWTSVDEFSPDCLFGACQMCICPKTFVHDCRCGSSLNIVGNLFITQQNFREEIVFVSSGGS